MRFTFSFLSLRLQYLLEESCNKVIMKRRATAPQVEESVKLPQIKRGKTEIQKNSNLNAKPQRLHAALAPPPIDFALNVTKIAINKSAKKETTEKTTSASKNEIPPKLLLPQLKPEFGRLNDIVDSQNSAQILQKQCINNIPTPKEFSESEPNSHALKHLH